MVTVSKYGSYLINGDIDRIGGDVNNIMQFGTEHQKEHYILCSFGA